MQKVWRGRTVRKATKQIVLKAKVVREMLDTEKTYADLLNMLLLMFVAPLRKMAESGRPLISLDDINVMFAQLEKIASFNERLLTKLKYRIEKWNAEQTIADVFVNIVSFHVSR